MCCEAGTNSGKYRLSWWCEDCGQEWDQSYHEQEELNSELYELCQEGKIEFWSKLSPFWEDDTPMRVKHLIELGQKSALFKGVVGTEMKPILIRIDFADISVRLDKKRYLFALQPSTVYHLRIATEESS